MPLHSVRDQIFDVYADIAGHGCRPNTAGGLQRGGGAYSVADDFHCGKKFTPKIVKPRSSNVSKSGDVEFQSFGLEFRNEDSVFSSVPSEATIRVMKGRRVDGKTFRKLPTKEILKQPGPSSGMPEVQGWSFENRPENVSWSHVKYVGPMRLEFGQRQGDMISGSIYLCVPKGQTSTFDKKPTSEDSYAIGTFTARIE